MSKTNKSDKFLKLVGEHKEKKKVEKFHGTLEEYLKILETAPGVAKLAHKRLYDAIEKEGVTRMSTSDSRCNKLFGGTELRTGSFTSRSSWGRQICSIGTDQGST